MDKARIDHLSTEALQQEWAVMSRDSRQAAWDRFTQDIDEGTAGWNRFRPILWPAYELDQPPLVNMIG